jgi:hypothetical protein
VARGVALHAGEDEPEYAALPLWDREWHMLYATCTPDDGYDSDDPTHPSGADGSAAVEP